jgi:DNA-binding NarL/FixJ family response regulator
MCTMIRVLVADDHGIMRDGLTSLFGAIPDVELVGTACDGGEAIARALLTKPDVVVMDVNMPNMDGLEATRRLTAELPGAAVLIFTSSSEQSMILAAIEAGACGFLLKAASADELLGAIRSAARGESPLDPKVANAVMEAFSAPSPMTMLTPREREILHLLAEGLPNKAIAGRLAITERTVKAHLTRAFRRVGVTDRTQAALWAERHGLGTAARF